MKQLNKTLFILALTLCVFLNVAAQQKSELSETDLQNLVKSARQKLEGKTYRATVISLSSENTDKITPRVEKTIREVVPPDRFHTISEKQTPAADGVKRREYIRIGKREFEKINDGEWKELSAVGSGSGSGFSGRAVDSEKSVEIKLKKGEIVNNRTTDLYEITTTTKYSLSSKIFTTVSKHGYWLDKNGMLVKTEDEYTNDTKRLDRITTEYEYDPNIKIEAPIKDAFVKP